MSKVSKRKSIIKKILMAIGIILIIMQFFRIDKSIPDYDQTKDFIAITNPPAEVQELLKSSCYDCHSYETKYPWYTNVAPVSWWIGHHIEEGREHLNFSEWGNYTVEKAEHKLEECGEETEEGEMPLPSYIITHGDAELTHEEMELLEEWFESEREKVLATMEH